MNQQLLDLLLEWHNNMPEVTPAMSLENQAKYLSKKYETDTFTLSIPVYNDETDNTDMVNQERILIKFKDVVCKYRPHLHLGDYWLDVNIRDSVPHYHFYHIQQNYNGTGDIINDAQHPHLSGGIPCLGSFQGDLATNFNENNFVQFFSIMKAYLQAYNGRSTYTRGSEYKKMKIHCQLHSYEDIFEMFHTEQEETGNELDVYGIAQDPMRWNWPKEMTAWAQIQIEGQVPKVLREYFQKEKYPYLQQIYRHDLFNWERGGTCYTQKILGYVYMAQQIGELTLFQAFEFVKIFLISLQAQFEGNMSEELMNQLSKLASDVYNTKDRNLFTVNQRYKISLDNKNREVIEKLWENLRPYSSNRGRDRDTSFINELKWGGGKLSNFMILLRKKAPHKASAVTYLYTTKETVDVDELQRRYNTVKKFAYGLALQQLEKDKRRFINEINRPEISNIVGDDGQGTLFSENL